MTGSQLVTVTSQAYWELDSGLSGLSGEYSALSFVTLILEIGPTDHTHFIEYKFYPY